MERGIPSGAVEKKGGQYFGNLLGFLKEYWQRISAAVCGINVALVKLDNCCLSCIPFPGKVTQKYFSKDLRSKQLMGSASRGRRINSNFLS